MNAIEFVKHIGIDDAKKVVDAFESVTDTKGEKMKISRNDGEGFEIDFDDLKRLVEAHELVEKFGGLERSKQHLNHRREYGLYQLPNLIHAIKLVESCQ